MTERWLELEWEGRRRRALLQGAEGSAPAPLLVALHGTGGTPRLMAKITGFTARAPGLVLYPAALGEPGSEDPARGAAWNAGPGLGHPAFPEADDAGFLRALIARLRETRSVDPSRIHLAGLSNGGRMAYRLALEAADLFASVAVIAGAWDGSGPKPSRPVSTLIFHGRSDQHIPYEGGLGAKGRRVTHHSAPETAFAWARLMGCAPKIQRSSSGAHHLDLARAADGTEVGLWTVEGQGHAWPGGRAWSAAADSPVRDLDATALILDFFARHPSR
ncbi:MAG TPA: PHB depolymerase family esterase [Holophagaceae bacterium]|nr:PHB depolymerase family esterase [Holophagaceae bacterium]